MNREGTCWSGVLGQGLYPPLILSRIHLRQMTGDLFLRKEVSRFTFHLERGNLLGCSTGIQGMETPVREAVKEVFSWGEGTYSYVLSSAGSGEGTAKACSTPELILDGVRAIRNLYLVEEALGRSEGLVQLSENPPNDTAFQFSPLESYLLSRLEGASTVEELSQLSPVTRPETLCSIYVLLCAGVVTAGDDPLQQEPASSCCASEGEMGGALRSFAELGPVKPPIEIHPSFSRPRQRFVPDTVIIGLPSNKVHRTSAPPAEVVDPVPAAAGDPLDMARYHFEKGLAHYANEDYHSAVQLFKLAVKIDDRKAEYHRHLALALSRNPKWGRKVEQVLIRAVELEPDHAETHYFLGRIYLDSGLPARAMARFRESLRIDPDLKPARLELAVMNGAARAVDREPVSIALMGRK